MKRVRNLPLIDTFRIFAPGDVYPKSKSVDIFLDYVMRNATDVSVDSSYYWAIVKLGKDSYRIKLWDHYTSDLSECYRFTDGETCRSNMREYYSGVMPTKCMRVRFWNWLLSRGVPYLTKRVYSELDRDIIRSSRGEKVWV